MSAYLREREAHRKLMKSLKEKKRVKAENVKKVLASNKEKGNTENTNLVGHGV